MVAQCNQVLTKVKEEVEKANMKGKEALEREAELAKQRKEKEQQEKKLQQPVRVDLSTSGGPNQAATQTQSAAGGSSSLGGTIVQCSFPHVNLKTMYSL